MRTRDGAELTGVDCSKPGSDADSEKRIRVVSGQMFDLLVKYSRAATRVEPPCSPESWLPPGSGREF